MNCLRTFALIIAAITSFAGFAADIEYRSVKKTAVLFANASESSQRLYIIEAGTPVEIVVSSGKWVRVREPAGAMAWIQADQLSPQRTVIVTQNRGIVRSEPKTNSPQVFEAERYTLLNLRATVQAPPGWLAVAHQDGAGGFIRISEIWGD